MRFLFFGVVLASATASAQPTRVRLEAKISRASCMATQAMNAIPHNRVNIPRLEEATGPAIRMLDEIAIEGDAKATLIAERTKADLYVAMAVRARNTVPAISSTTVGPALALHDALHSQLEADVQPWLDHATAAYQAVAAIGNRNPELGDGVVRTAMRESERALETTPQTALR
jgi:hypothetical protein